MSKEATGALIQAGNATPTIPDPVVKPTLTVEEAGNILGLSRGSAYEGIKTGEIPSLRIGRRVIVPTAQLRALLGLDTAA